MTTRKVPVTVLTGHLGAGKTTLLNRILSGDKGKKYAVIVNEFGEIGIDNELIVESDEEIYEMNNGCICCTVRGDLIGVMLKLLRRPGRFDAIVVETTGVADPAPVVQTFLMDEDVRRQVELDAVITLVDAMHYPLRLADSQEAEDQVAFADVVLINKVDLVDADALASVERRVAAINPYAARHRVRRADIDLSKILQIGAFDLQRFQALYDFGEAPAPHGCDDPDHEHGPDCGHAPEHQDGGHAHRHTISVASLSLRAGEIDGNRFFPWIQDLVKEKGPDILRMKGILALKGDERRCVVQGVHMIVEADHQQAWPEGEPRASRLVFIGRNLDMEGLRRQFEACQAVASCHELE